MLQIVTITKQLKKLKKSTRGRFNFHIYFFKLKWSESWNSQIEIERRKTKYEKLSKTVKIYPKERKVVNNT